MATRVLLRGQQAPEAYLDVSAPLPAGTDLARPSPGNSAALDAAFARPTRSSRWLVTAAVIEGVRNWNERFGALRGGR